MNQPDELIFGKNAVLAYIERSADSRDADFSEDCEDEEEQGLEVLNQLQPEEDKPADRHKLERLSKVNINKILIASQGRPDGRIARILELARKYKIPVQTCERKKLDQLAGPDKRHQGIIAFVSPAELWQLDSFLQKMAIDQAERSLAGKSMDGYMVALLDGIEDPHNLGAIIRVAEAAGVKGILIPQFRSAGLTGTVAKISAGAVANIPVVRVSNLVQAIETFKKSGFWVVGLDGKSSQLYTGSDLVRPLLVVIGSEGTGMGRLVRQHCDFLVRIPMLGKTESLNASVASGIMFYEVVRQNLK